MRGVGRTGGDRADHEDSAGAGTGSAVGLAEPVELQGLLGVPQALGRPCRRVIDEQDVDLPVPGRDGMRLAIRLPAAAVLGRRGTRGEPRCRSGSGWRLSSDGSACSVIPCLAGRREVIHLRDGDGDGDGDRAGGCVFSMGGGMEPGAVVPPGSTRESRTWNGLALHRGNSRQSSCPSCDGMQAGRIAPGPASKRPVRNNLLACRRPGRRCSVPTDMDCTCRRTRVGRMQELTWRSQIDSPKRFQCLL